MFGIARRITSARCSRGTLSDAPCQRATAQMTGKPISMPRVRNASGGKFCTPIFMIGQLMPQTSVRMISRVQSLRVSVFIAER
jgi:hypothetical protein